MKTFEFTYESKTIKSNNTKTQILDVNRKVIKIGDKLEIKDHSGHGITKIILGELVGVNVCGDLMIKLFQNDKIHTINIQKNVESNENDSRIITLGSKYMAPHSNVIINTYVKKLN